MPQAAVYMAPAAMEKGKVGRKRGREGRRGCSVMVAEEKRFQGAVGQV